MKDSRDNLKLEAYDERKQLDIVSLTQIDKDSMLICHDRFVKILGLDGVVKKNLSYCSIFEFPFKIEALSELKFLEFQLFQLNSTFTLYLSVFTGPRKCYCVS